MYQPPRHTLKQNLHWLCRPGCNAAARCGGGSCQSCFPALECVSCFVMAVPISRAACHKIGFSHLTCTFLSSKPSSISRDLLRKWRVWREHAQQGGTHALHVGDLDPTPSPTLFPEQPLSTKPGVAQKRENEEQGRVTHSR